MNRKGEYRVRKQLAIGAVVAVVVSISCLALGLYFGLAVSKRRSSGENGEDNTNAIVTPDFNIQPTNETRTNSTTTKNNYFPTNNTFHNTTTTISDNSKNLKKEGSSNHNSTESSHSTEVPTVEETNVTSDGAAATQLLKAEDFYTDLQDVRNPDWEELVQNLTVGENSYGPAYGSTIRVNQALLGYYQQNERKPNSGKDNLRHRFNNSNNNAQRPSSSYIQHGIMKDNVDYDDRSVILHTPINSYIGRRYFPLITRWYQEDGLTQIFRMFPGEDNIRNDRLHAPRSEAANADVTWRRGDGWHAFSARYTFVKVRQGIVFQIKHNETYWSIQLLLEEQQQQQKEQQAEKTPMSNLTNEHKDNKTTTPPKKYDLVYRKLRDPQAKTILERDVLLKSYNITVQDDGTFHKIYVNNDLRIQGNMTDRSSSETNTARWGFYSPRSPIDRDILIFVTNATVTRM